MRIVVSGSLAQRPFRGGHAWVFLQYLLGFSRLGCDVLFLDRLEPEMCAASDGSPCSPERSLNLRFLADVMEAFGLADAFAVLVDGADGLSVWTGSAVVAWVRKADLLLDIMGYLQCEEVLEAARFKVFLDIDPGFTQMWWALGLHDPFGNHDAYATFGRHIGHPECSIPSCGIAWVHTQPPVVLEQWPVRPAESRRMTSVCTWRGPYAPVEYRGQTYGLRAHRFRQLVDLPARSPMDLELALDIDRADQADRALLLDNGWHLIDPTAVASEPCSYREYIQGSAAELMVAKDMYARSNSGWFSDRSACYLASGKPVVAEDTGLASLYPIGHGLLTFRGSAEASAAIASLWGDYAEHSEAARALAESQFDSDRVLPRLLNDLARS